MGIVSSPILVANRRAVVRSLLVRVVVAVGSLSTSVALAQPSDTDPPQSAPSESPPPEPPPSESPPPEPAPPPPPPPPPEPPKTRSLLRAYTDYIDAKVEEIGSLDLYGITAPMPRGYLKLRYEYNPASAREYFDRDGHRTRLLPPISLSGFPTAKDQLTVDPIVSGSGAGHTFGLAYGITSNLEAFVSVPFQSVTSTMDLRISRGGVPLTDFESTLVKTYVAANGRPVPGSSFSTTMDLADIQAGTSWNFHRTKTFSANLTPRIIFPTGNRANPNNDLTFFRGPEIDRGLGAWGVGLSHAFDVRPVRWLTLSAEVGTTYRFKVARQSPKWNAISDCRRVQDAARRAALSCGPAVGYDRAYDLEQSQVFPDMSGLDDTFDMTSGLSESVQVGFTLRPIPIPIQASYIFQRNEAPVIHATGAGDSGPAFERSIQLFQLLNSSSSHTLAVGVSIPLFPVYIPAIVTLGARLAFAGTNTIILQNNYSLAIEMFLPIGEAFGVKPKNPMTAAVTSKRL